MDDDSGSEGELDAQAEMAKLLTSVKDMGLYNLSMIATQAWHHLGLTPMPGVDDTGVDLLQAKLAIDLYEANLNVLSETLEKDTDKQLRRILMDLQLNFVNKSKKE